MRYLPSRQFSIFRPRILLPKVRSISNLTSSRNSPNPRVPAGSVIYDPRLVVGPSRGVEAGINVASFHQPDTTEVLLQPNLKWRFFNNDNDGIAAAAGGILYSPANHRDTLSTFGLLYG